MACTKQRWLPTDLLIPAAQIRGVEDGTEREAILDLPRTNGLTHVPVHVKRTLRPRTGSAICVLDLKLSTQPVSSLDQTAGCPAGISHAS